MISIRPSAVPIYLHSGDFFKSLDLENDEEIAVPSNVVKDDIVIHNADDMEHLLSSLSFWGVEHIPYETVSFVLADKSFPLNSSLDVAYPVISLLRSLQQCKNADESFRLAVSEGSLYMTEYFVSKGCKINDKLCILAAKSGHASLLKYLHKQGGKIHIITARMAFTSGNIDCLDYLRDQGAMAKITGNLIGIKGSFYKDPQNVYVPNLETLKYAQHVGCVINELTTSTAAECGKLDILEYLHGQQCAWDTSTAIKAAQFGHLDCLQFAYEHGARCNLTCLNVAAEHNHLHIMTYLHEVVRIPWPEDCFIYAGGYNSLECLIYAHSHGCPVNVAAHRFAVLKKYPAVVAYLEAHGIVSGEVQQA